MAHNACLVVKASYDSGCRKNTLEKQALLAGTKQCREAVKAYRLTRVPAGNTKVGSITVLLTSCLTGLESAV
jgi:hypothetical protein